MKFSVVIGALSSNSSKCRSPCFVFMIAILFIFSPFVRAINNGDVVAAQKIVETYVIPNMSPESLDYYDMCVTNMPKYKSVKEEWGI